KRSGTGATARLTCGSIASGVVSAVAAWRLRAVRSVRTILAVGPLVFLTVFLFGSKVEELVFPATVHAAVANVDSSTPVVYLLLDEFPLNALLDADGEIDAKRFPNFARLARTSTWFRNTTTLSATTTVAVPVILTGNPPI